MLWTQNQTRRRVAYTTPLENRANESNGTDQAIRDPAVTKPPDRNTQEALSAYRQAPSGGSQPCSAYHLTSLPSTNESVTSLQKILPVTEVPYSGKDHRQPQPVRCLDYLSIPDGSTRLDYRRCTGIGHRLQ